MQTPPATIWHGLPAEIWLSLATVLAILVGPIIAVQVDKVLQLRREKRTRKVWIFRELMITRSTRLTARHVEALNAIQMEFSEKQKKEKPVIEAWQLYMNHLNTPAGDNLPGWIARGTDLLVGMLYEMGAALGYDFPKAKIERDVYIPQYFGTIETEQNELRKAALAVFKGERKLPVEVHEGPR